MRFLVLLQFFLLVAGFSFGQPNTTVFQRIHQEAHQNGQAYASLGKATAAIGHRLTGSENGVRAEQLAYDLLKSYGFKDVVFQPFEVESWSREVVSLSVKTSDSTLALPVVSLAHSPVTADVEAPLIDIGSGLRADFERVKEQVRGKIAFFYIGKLPSDKEARNLHRSEKTALAIEYGAAGVIIYNQVKGGVLLTGTASVTGELIPIPAACIGLENGERIRNQLSRGEAVTARLTMTNRSAIIKARNVVATLKGSKKPNEIILIGGHLDSWDLATGALDNGIGSFTVLDIARVFKTLKLKPERTIQFVLFMGEEEGLLGSKALVEQRKKAGTLDKVKLMLNLDMTANPIGYVTGGRSEMEPLVKSIGSEIAVLDTSFRNKIDAKAGLHSDHQPFLLEGIPVMQPMSNLDRSVYGCYHSDCDNFNLVNKEHLERSVSINTKMLFGLANAKEIPARKLNSEETRDLLIKQELKEQLVLGKEWRW